MNKSINKSTDLYHRYMDLSSMLDFPPLLFYPRVGDLQKHYSVVFCGCNISNR